jgi:hypothetical protein
VSAEVWLNPPKLKAFCVPRTKSADLSNRLPKRPVLPGFTSVADGARGMALPSTYSVVLTARTRRVPACDADAGDEAHQGPPEREVPARDCFTPGSQGGKLRFVATLRVTVSRKLPGPTTTGDRTLTTDWKHKATDHYCVRPWSEIYEPDPARLSLGM